VTASSRSGLGASVLVTICAILERGIDRLPGLGFPRESRDRYHPARLPIGAR
jgi:hypothetical protein